MGHPIEEDQLACSAFDAGYRHVPEKSLNEEGERYRGSRLVEGAEWTAKKLYENSASVRLATQGLSKVGQGLNWLGKPLIQASEQNQTAPIYPGATIEGRSGSAILGDVIRGGQWLIDKSGEGAEYWGNKINLDPRISQTIGKGAAEELLTVGTAKALKGASKLKINQSNIPALATVDNVPVSTLNRVEDFNPAQPLMFKKQPRTPETQQLINVNREFKPKGFNTNKWDNYIAKFGSKEGAEAAIKKAEESAAYLKKYGSLKGNKNIWTDPKTGESFLVKNKAKRGEINIGFDSVKMIERTLAKRLEGAKLNTKEIGKIGKELGWDQKKITKYIETSEQAKRTLESLIKDLNKGEGRTMWSLGHRRAVKTQAHSADRITNIELEPLVDVLTEAGRTIKGNTGRAANDELIDILSKITNNPADLKADMIHWGDDIVGKFMPRMREITDAKSFFEEIVKREDFLNKITQYAKKEGVDLEEAADVVMRPLMDKTKVFEETFFDIRSNGF